MLLKKLKYRITEGALAFYPCFLTARLARFVNLPVAVLLLAGVFALFACKKSDAVVKPPVVIPVPTVSYQKINLASVNQVQVVQKSTWQYELKTTGTDPYLYLEALSGSNHPDSVVLTFEYQSSADIGDFQIFFASPVSEARSVKAGTISAKPNWSSYSVDLSTYIRQFSWGTAGEFLRLDFGNQSGVTIQIRNIHLRSLNAAEKAESLAREELIKNDLLLESNLKKYLETNFASRITEVKVSSASIRISGNYAGTGEFSICEIRPYDHLTQITKFANKFVQGNAVFSFVVDRFAVSNGLKYDRLLSKWAIAKTVTTTDEIVSHAIYA